MDGVTLGDWHKHIHLSCPSCGVKKSIFHSMKTEPSTFGTVLWPTGVCSGINVYSIGNTCDTQANQRDKCNAFGTSTDQHMQTHTASPSCFHTSVRSIKVLFWSVLLPCSKNRVHYSFLPTHWAKMCQLIFPTHVDCSWNSTQRIGQRRL
jgi:hypothetical protein